MKKKDSQFKYQTVLGVPGTNDNFAYIRLDKVKLGNTDLEGGIATTRAHDQDGQKQRTLVHTYFGERAVEGINIDWLAIMNAQAIASRQAETQKAAQQEAETALARAAAAAEEDQQAVAAAMAAEASQKPARTRKKASSGEEAEGGVIVIPEGRGEEIGAALVADAERQADAATEAANPTKRARTSRKAMVAAAGTALAALSAGAPA